ncbi:MAG: ABC transporter permease, partial [Pricia sp.]
MFRNYLKIAFRSILKHKAFSLINIIGLSIGLSSAFVIGAMIYYDLTFDKFHEDGERIYRITSDFYSPEGNFHNRGVAVPLADYAKEDMTGLETASLFFTVYFPETENEVSGKTFRNVEDAILADPSYFELFDYEWLAGSPKSLSEPGQMVLTEERAAKYFPDEPLQEVIGKTLIYNDNLPVKITGIVADLNQRTDLYLKEFLSLKTVRNTPMEARYHIESWNSSNSDTQLFVKLASNATAENIQEQLDRVAHEHADKEMLALGQKRSFHLQPLADIHFNADYGIFKSSEHMGDRRVLAGLGLAALFLLVLGGINFINLNTAQATRRAKEIGIRKTLGSSKKQLVAQFLLETLLLVLAAVLVSIVLASWLFRVFSDFMPEDVGMGLLTTGPVLIAMLVLVVAITLLSGFYPALVLSQFKPVSVLKNQVFSGSDKSALRKYLTVFQFVIAQIFIVATLVVGRQLHFLVSKDMGFKTEANA